MTEEVPKDIQQFLWSVIDSIAQLEVLLLLRSQPQRFWTSNELAAELRIDPAGAMQQILPLVKRGVVQTPSNLSNSFAYGVKTPEADSIISTIARLYVERRVTIVTLIYSRPPEEARDTTDPARRFADAFRLRPPDKQ